MQRIRLLRTLIPLLLIVFIGGVFFTRKARPPHEKLPESVSSEPGARAEGFSFSDLAAGRRRLLVKARLGRIDERGAFDVDDVQRVEIDRETQPPLVLTAEHGSGAGAEGKRLMRLTGGVTLHDDDTGFDLILPIVEVNQITGVVRSVGTVKIQGAVWKGSASEVTYSLKNLPAQIEGLSIEGANGARLVARHAVIEPGSRTMTLEGDVDATQAGMTVRAPMVVLVRGADGRIESATASPSVAGTLAGTESGSFQAREARILWGALGKVSALTLSGGARVAHTRGGISADRIDAKAEAGSAGYVMDASGDVTVTGSTKKGLGRMSCATLHAHVDAAMNLRDGTASGNVAFDAEETTGEAAEARFSALDATGQVTLKASPDRRARVGSARIRIVAETIDSDLRGVKLVANGHVESTLLPATGAKVANAPPMFEGGEAVHFVSASLESDNAGARLLFRGDVRGWQGERTLSADEVEMIQEGEILNAEGHVATRLPRVAGRAASEADYIQVVADRLAYRGTARTAEYTGSVRVRQAEGWLEAPRLVALLAEGGHGLREVQAGGGVRFEYRAPGGQAVPSTATGEGDRATYETGGRVIRLFGEKAPATVRNTGATGGTTVGRVLRYHLDTGALEVESGERDRATIKTPKG